MSDNNPNIFNKFLPPRDGIFFCPEADCNFSVDRLELVHLDNENDIPWFQLNKKSNNVFPGCPTHGKPLTFIRDDVLGADSNCEGMDW